MLRHRRNVKDPGVILSGKESVYTSLTDVAGRCNKLITIKQSGLEQAFMNCTATIKSYNNNSVESSYDSINCIHAEMSALEKHILANKSIASIRNIHISSPPCKCCAFVLELFGVINRVTTTGSIWKMPTGSWAWPASLQVPDKFDTPRWKEIKLFFESSGLNEKEVLKNVIRVIQSKSYLS